MVHLVAKREGELIRPQETGFLFESGNVEALAETLAQVQGQPISRLLQMGAAARAWMRSEFSPPAYRDRMLALYSQLNVIATRTQEMDEGSHDSREIGGDEGNRAGIAWDS